MLYDKNLSVYRNEACAFCHMPETGFTGPVSELNRTTGAYPGSVRTRFSDRKPQSHAYAPLSPVLHYNPGRATWSAAISGICVRQTAARQSGRRAAQGPPTNRWKWAFPISPAQFIGLRSGLIVLCSKACGAAGLRHRLAERRGRGLQPAGRRSQVSQCRSPEPD